MNRFAAFFLALLPAFALAQEPPSRVARVAWTQGEVAVFHEEDRGWEKAFVNTPLTSENSLWTEPQARAEVRVGGTALRLDDVTQLDLARLDDLVLRAFVPRGTVAVRIRHFESGERYVIATPHGRFRMLGNGRYRVDVDDERGQTRFTVFAGRAELDSGRGNVTVAEGQAIRLYGEGSAYDFERARSDAFDQWAMARDQRLAGRESVRYVSPHMTGYEDLDEYGNWSTEPDYGAIWYPTRITADWAPYRDGHWTHVRPFGWTWVDHAPWGYAPFHYGRWVYVRDRWGWIPGRTIVRRPVWAPALVGWVGGSSFNVTISAGGGAPIGWYPLAPWDRYQPWYNASPRYVSSVNVIVVNRPQRYRDYDFNRYNGATVQSREGFVSRAPVRNTMVRVSREALQQSTVLAPTAVLPPRTEIRRGERDGNRFERRPGRDNAPAPAAPATGTAATVPFSRAPANMQRGAPVQRGEERRDERRDAREERRDDRRDGREERRDDRRDRREERRDTREPQSVAPVQRGQPVAPVPGAQPAPSAPPAQPARPPQSQGATPPTTRPEPGEGRREFGRGQREERQGVRDDRRDAREERKDDRREAREERKEDRRAPAPRVAPAPPVAPAPQAVPPPAAPVQRGQPAVDPQAEQARQRAAQQQREQQEAARAQQQQRELQEAARQQQQQRAAEQQQREAVRQQQREQRREAPVQRGQPAPAAPSAPVAAPPAAAPAEQPGAARERRERERPAREEKEKKEKEEKEEKEKEKEKERGPRR